MAIQLNTALTLGRAVAGSAARLKACNIGREEPSADHDADTPRLCEEHVTAPVFLLGKTIQLLPNADGELRAADGEQPADPVGVLREPTGIYWDGLGSMLRTKLAEYEYPQGKFGLCLRSRVGLSCADLLLSLGLYLLILISRIKYLR